jgi:hypothetical protein
MSQMAVKGEEDFPPEQHAAGGGVRLAELRMVREVITSQ